MCLGLCCALLAGALNQSGQQPRIHLQQFSLHTCFAPSLCTLQSHITSCATLMLPMLSLPRCTCSVPAPCLLAAPGGITGWQPKINTALWNTIQLLFPQHAAEAPPPTPPGQTQPAAAAPAQARRGQAAVGPSRRQTAVLGGRAAVQDDDDDDMDYHPSGDRMFAGWGDGSMTRSSSDRLYHMADAVAATRGRMDMNVAAVRQPFRAPR